MSFDEHEINLTCSRTRIFSREQWFKISTRTSCGKERIVRVRGSEQCIKGAQWLQLQFIGDQRSVVAEYFGEYRCCKLEGLLIVLGLRRVACEVVRCFA